MGPPPDKEMVLGGPPMHYVPAPLANGGSVKVQGAISYDVLAEKYSRLKKRYFDLEQKQKDTTLELERSGQRNLKLREERNLLLDRIIELEQNVEQQRRRPSHSPNGDAAHPVVPPPISGAFPRSLISQRSQQAFISNLKQAMSEIDTEDHDIDPVMTSRHVGPNVRKRQATDEREKPDEEIAREAQAQSASAAGTGSARRATKRQRGGSATTSASAAGGSGRNTGK